VPPQNRPGFGTLSRPIQSESLHLMFLRFKTFIPMLFALGMASTSVFAQSPQLDLQRTRLSTGMYQIDAQLALTPQQQQTGLMHRKEMPQAEGMLFVFERASTQCFWMKNTLLPLTAAFVADDGRIVNLVDMQPLSLESHCSEEPVRFVLEMNQGWFAKKNIKKGAKLAGEAFQARR